MDLFQFLDLESKFMSRLLISITDREFFRFPSGIRMFFFDSGNCNQNKDNQEG